MNNKAIVYLFDDDLKKKISSKLNHKLKSFKELSKIKFDKIIISPGIDISKCRLSKFYKKTYPKFQIH